MTGELYLLARLDGNAFAVPLHEVRQVVACQAVAVPFAPEGVCGAAVWEREVVAVVDVFGHRTTPPPLMIVCDHGGHCIAYAAEQTEEWIEVGCTPDKNGYISHKGEQVLLLHPEMRLL